MEECQCRGWLFVVRDYAVIRGCFEINRSNGMPNKRFDAVKEIDGWFYMEDAILFETISTVQAKSRITGDLLEIGAYHGKSAAFLGFLLGAKDQLVVCDLFETPAATADNQAEKEDWYPTLDRETFERCYLHIHAHLPRILTCQSSRVMRVGNLSQTFRFIHIDGSHLYQIVKQDLHTSSKLLKRGGIVAIDDYRSAHTPGVAAATWEAVSAGRLIPICITPQKMYATFDARNVAWFRTLRDWGEAQHELDIAIDKVCSRQILRFSTKP